MSARMTGCSTPSVSTTNGAPRTRFPTEPGDLMTSRALAASIFFVTAAAAAATIAPSAQQGPPQAALPSLPPPRGAISVRPETATAILAAVKAPAGFTVTALAAPPVSNYPACITATHDGVVFVCVDR